MRIEPVKRYSQPGYPTRDIVDTNPDLLRATPNRWRGNVAVLAALTAACGIVAARWTAAQAEEKKPPTASMVAPIFTHGEGRESMAGIAGMFVPPVFFTEEEARKVIQDELKKSGVECAPDAKTIDLIVPAGKTYTQEVTIINPDGTKTTEYQEKQGDGTAPLALLLDGTDAKKNVSYEYVSDADQTSWPTSSLPWDNGPLTTKTTATTVRKALDDKKPAGAYAFFYEPRIDRKYDENGKPIGTDEDARNQGKEELRAQVKDFVAWLKAEGVI